MRDRAGGKARGALRTCSCVFLSPVDSAELPLPHLSPPAPTVKGLAKEFELPRPPASQPPALPTGPHGQSQLLPAPSLTTVLHVLSSFANEVQE